MNILTNLNKVVIVSLARGHFSLSLSSTSLSITSLGNTEAISKSPSFNFLVISLLFISLKILPPMYNMKVAIKLLLLSMKNYYLLLTSATTLFISLLTIMIPSSTPIPGLANCWSAPVAIEIFTKTSADLLVSLQVPPQYAPTW